MSSFLTVKEAALLMGKSPSSIRRIIYPIVESDQHPDRPQIQPSVEDVLRLRMQGENFAWRISEELLRREVRVDPTAEKGSRESRAEPPRERDDALVEMLRGELEIKNGQITQQSDLIARQMELISGLSERLREGNVLLGSLQQQLTLGDGRGRTGTGVVDADTQSSKPPETTKPPRRRWLLRLFS